MTIGGPNTLAIRTATEQIEDMHVPILRAFVSRYHRAQDSRIDRGSDMREFLARVAAFVSRPHAKTGVGLTWHLLIPIAVVAIPLIALNAWIVAREYSQQRARAEQRILAHAHTLAALVDREFSRTEKVGEILARSASLSRGDLGGFEAEMSVARDVLAADAEKSFDAVFVRLWSPDRRLLMTVPPELPLGIVPHSTHIADAFATGKFQISNLFFDRGTETWRLGIALPAFRDSGASATNVVTIGIPRERLRSILALSDLPT